MDQLAVDQSSRIDQAFAGNQLLSTFPPELRKLIGPDCEIADLKLGKAVQERGQSPSGSLFPFGETTVSMVVRLNHGRTIEVASLGREGAVGGIISCGHAPAFAEARVQIAGPALRVPMQVLEHAKHQSPFLANLFCRYSDYLLAQVMQSVACNTFHSIQERAARWLLTASDRGGERIELTQEALAGLLGVQRTTVNAVVRSLQAEGLIAIRRGTITIIDRSSLEEGACECHKVLEKHFDAVIGSSGDGTM